jgi:hypothetical protein
MILIGGVDRGGGGYVTAATKIKIPGYAAESPWFPASAIRTVILLFSDVLIPHCGIPANIIAQQQGTLRRVKIKDAHAERAQPFQASLKIAALSDHQRTEAKLPDQSTAIPARRKRRNHGQVSITALASRIAEGIGLAMHGRIIILHATVTTRADALARRIKDRSSDRNASFGQPLASLRQRDRQHCRMVKLQHGRDYIEEASLASGDYCSFAYSALACFRTGMSGSASFQSVRKSL